MAKIVSVIATAHTPGASGWLDSAPVAEQKAVVAGFTELRQILERARPDVLIGVGNDHLLNLPLISPPHFCVGSAAAWQGPADFFKDWLKQDGYRVAGAPDVAVTLAAAGRAANLQIDMRSDLLFDDNWSVPLLYLTPSYDIPFVPIHMNCINPPVPSPEQSFHAGKIFGRAIRDQLPDDLRVAFMASGGLSHEPGGARYFTLDEDFDRWFLELLVQGDEDKVKREATVERMNAAGGGGTTELLAWMVAMAVAGGASARAVFYVGSAALRCGTGAITWTVS